MSDTQSGFIPDRIIADNIRIGAELIIGYSRSNMSVGCQMKVDNRKAYNYVEWNFLES